MIKACAISDIHGALPEIGQCDVLFICGDIFPLEIQNNAEKCHKWLLNKFSEWVKSIPCKTVYFIGGNHDKWIESIGYDEVTRIIEEETNLHGKLVYIEDGLIEIEGGLTVYGCPWCIGPIGWSFVDTLGGHYELIPDCDILLTHQPPKIEKLGCSYPNTKYERDFGSLSLKECICKKKIKYNFCGHIHTGVHGLVKVYDCDTQFYNVSLKDEDYNLTFKPTYVEITT